MNAFILNLFDTFSKRKVEYCHFKSNNNLVPALNGVDDLDVLVAWKDADKFMQIISEKGFRIATDRNSVPTPFVYHYFGVDPDTGLIVHLHVYFRLVTGGSILKNHWIRVEHMFLQSAKPVGEGGVFIPSAEADLILFVIRKCIEQPSLIEHFLFLRDWENIQAELTWLLERADRSVVRELVAEWLPEVPVELIDSAIDLLEKKGSIIDRVRLGIRVRRLFKNTVFNESKASILRTIVFFTAYFKGKLKIRRKDRYIFPGGMIIAFTGSEASGKSTLSKEIATWLSERFDVSHIHMGKPPKNWRTRPFWLGIEIYSRLKTKLTNSNVSEEKSDMEGTEVGADRVAANQPHPIICWLDSIDRKYWLKTHCFRMMQGGIVITDRYPANQSGGLDGARIEANSEFTKMLSRWELRNYQGLPQPDLVFKAVAPLEVTLERNRLRDNPEPEVFVRQRYELAREINFERSIMVEVDTTRCLSETILAVKNKVWRGKP